MSKTRRDSFENTMKTISPEIVDYISEYVPEEKNKTIVKTNNYWSPGVIDRDNDAFTGITDRRYNELPEYQKDLALKLWKYGIFEQVKYTLDRWYSKDVDQNWDKFIENYPFGNGISPYAIKDILKKEKWLYIGGKRFIKMRTKRRISRKRNTKKRRSKK